MKIIETLTDAVSIRRREVADAAARRFHSSVRAVLRAKDGKNLEIVGSCLLLKVDGSRYVVTAAHILDDLDSHELYVASTVGKQPVQMVGTMHMTKAPAEGRSKDKVDIGFWRMSQVQVEQLGEVSFVDEFACSHNKAPMKNRLYLALGYPVSKNKKGVNNPRKSISTSLAKYIAELSFDPKIPEHYGVSGDRHLFLKYHKMSETDDGEKRKTFDPHGLSGGPLVDLGDFGTMKNFVPTSLLPVSVAGITIERIAKHQVVVATRIQVVIEAIRSHIDD